MVFPKRLKLNTVNEKKKKNCSQFLDKMRDVYLRP